MNTTALTRLFVVALMALSLTAEAGELKHKSSVFAEPSEDSQQIAVLQQDLIVVVTGDRIASQTDDDSWVPIRWGKQRGYVRLSSVRLDEGDVGYDTKAPKPSTPAAVAVEEGWRPSWHAQLSPIGYLVGRYNLELSHFFGQSFELGVKGTKIVHASQTIFGQEDGSEVGLRATYDPFVSSNGSLRLGGALGAYYANFKRGNSLGDALDTIFLPSGTIDRDEINGPMFEVLVGGLAAVNSWLTLEVLGGVQTYGVSYYTYNTASGSRVTRKPSSWEAGAVVEFNLGIAF